MTARLRPLCIAFFLCMVAAADSLYALGEYRTVEIESLRIIFDSEWGVRGAPGYLPVRFDITNLGDARVIEIVGRGSRFFRGRAARPSAVTIQQVLRLSRGDRVRFTIPIPIYADNESIRFEIREGQRTLEHFNFIGLQSRIRHDEAPVLIAADTTTPFGKMAAGWLRPLAMPGRATYTPRGGTATSVTIAPAPSRPLDFVLNPARLPSNWLGFTSLRAVVIGSAEWSQLNDAQKDAMLTWTACGGDLLLVDGDVAALFAAGQRVPGASMDGPAGAYFFGRIHLFSSTAIQTSGLAGVLAKVSTLKDANWALPVNSAGDWGVVEKRGFRLQIPGVGGVPARAYLSILIVFALLIGPANYWLLWRKRQQVLLVLTTPVISVVFILLLAGYVVAGEGLGVYGRAVSFTMLDQARKQAVTRVSASLYAAGMTPSGGLRFARDVAVFTLGPEGTGSRVPQTVDLTDLQAFPEGGIQARSPANIETIALRPARERLNFSREAGGIRVVNGLGATVRSLFYREGNAIYRLAAALPDGGQAALQPDTKRPSEVVPAGLPLSSRFEHLFERLPDGAYLAVLDRTPFWEPGVARVEERDSFHVVFGWVAGQP